MPATLHMCPINFYCRLHIEPTTLHTSIKSNELQHIVTTLLTKNVCHQLIFPSNAQRCHMPKLLNGHSLGEYGNIHAQYEVAPTNDVAGIATTQTTMPQPDYIH